MAEARYYIPSGARPALRATEKKNSKNKFEIRAQCRCPSNHARLMPGTCLALLSRYSESDPRAGGRSRLVMILCGS